RASSTELTVIETGSCDTGWPTGASGGVMQAAARPETRRPSAARRAAEVEGTIGRTTRETDQSSRVALTRTPEHCQIALNLGRDRDRPVEPDGLRRAGGPGTHAEVELRVESMDTSRLRCEVVQEDHALGGEL